MSDQAILTDVLAVLENTTWPRNHWVVGPVRPAFASQEVLTAALEQCLTTRSKREVFSTIRIALVGNQPSLPLSYVLDLFGKDLTLLRIRWALLKTYLHSPTG